MSSKSTRSGDTDRNVLERISTRTPAVLRIRSHSTGSVSDPPLSLLAIAGVDQPKANPSSCMLQHSNESQSVAVKSCLVVRPSSSTDGRQNKFYKNHLNGDNGALPHTHNTCCDRNTNGCMSDPFPVAVTSLGACCSNSGPSSRHGFLRLVDELPPVASMEPRRRHSHMDMLKKRASQSRSPPPPADVVKAIDNNSVGDLLADEDDDETNPHGDSRRSHSPVEAAPLAQAVVAALKQHHNLYRSTTTNSTASSSRFSPGYLSDDNDDGDAGEEGEEEADSDTDEDYNAGRSLRSIRFTTSISGATPDVDQNGERMSAELDAESGYGASCSSSSTRLCSGGSRKDKRRIRRRIQQRRSSVGTSTTENQSSPGEEVILDPSCASHPLAVQTGDSGDSAAAVSGSRRLPTRHKRNRVRILDDASPTVRGSHHRGRNPIFLNGSHSCNEDGRPGIEDDRDTLLPHSEPRSLMMLDFSKHGYECLVHSQPYRYANRLSVDGESVPSVPDSDNDLSGRPPERGSPTESPSNAVNRQPDGTDPSPVPDSADTGLAPGAALPPPADAVPTASILVSTTTQASNSVAPQTSSFGYSPAGSFFPTGRCSNHVCDLPLPISLRYSHGQTYLGQETYPGDVQNNPVTLSGDTVTSMTLGDQVRLISSPSSAVPFVPATSCSGGNHQFISPTQFTGFVNYSSPVEQNSKHPAGAPRNAFDPQAAFDRISAFHPAFVGSFGHPSDHSSPENFDRTRCGRRSLTSQTPEDSPLGSGIQASQSATTPGYLPTAYSGPMGHVSCLVHRGEYSNQLNSTGTFTLCTAGGGDNSSISHEPNPQVPYGLPQTDTELGFFPPASYASTPYAGDPAPAVAYLGQGCSSPHRSNPSTGMNSVRSNGSLQDGRSQSAMEQRRYSIPMEPFYEVNLSSPINTLSRSTGHSRVSLVVDNVRFIMDAELLQAHPDTMLGRMLNSQFSEGIQLHDSQPEDYVGRAQSAEERAAGGSASGSDVLDAVALRTHCSSSRASSHRPSLQSSHPPDIPLGRNTAITAQVFRAVLDFYLVGRMSCPPGVPVQELKEACDYFMVPFNQHTVRCSNLRAFLHELSNDGAHAIFERFLEAHILSLLVKCAGLGERECHVVIVTDDEIIDWDPDYPPQMPENELHSHIIYSTQMFRFLKYNENREVAKQVLMERGLKKIRIGIEGYPTSKDRVKFRPGLRPEAIYNYVQCPFLRMSWEEEENKSRHVDFQCVKSKSVSDLTTGLEQAVVDPLPPHLAAHLRISPPVTINTESTSFAAQVNTLDPDIGTAQDERAEQISPNYGSSPISPHDVGETAHSGLPVNSNRDQPADTDPANSTDPIT
ncbi:unnamed protein product [Calicophoron daubneyi]|uniref:BTBD10/KCTD20 BTB/POZ domain-containing protein n=1 Tax=Calicophoron daubneyi TaxID=300641 RepID=A0AAV2TH28_CALDB